MLTVVTPVLVGRLFGTAGLGRWTLIVAAGTLLHTAFINWTHSPTLRFGREEWVRSGTIAQTVRARLPLLALSVATAIAVLIVQPADWLARWFLLASRDWWLVGLYATGVWLAAEAQSVLQATDRFTQQAALAPLIGMSSIATVLAAHALGLNSFSVAAALLALSPIIGWGLALAFNLVRLGVSGAGRPVVDAGQQLRYAWPLVPAFALGYISTWASPLMLSGMSSVDEVGLFGLAYPFLAATLSVNSVVATFGLPWLIRREVEAPGAMRIYVRSVVPTLFALWMVGTIWLVAVLPLSVALLTDREFQRSVALLPVLLTAVPASVVTSLYTGLFDLQGRLARLVIFMVPAIVVNAAACWLLIPGYGAAGAAVGSALSMMVGQALYIWDQHQQLQVSPASVWLLWLAGGIAGLSQLVVSTHPVSRIVWALVATAALSLVVRRAHCVDADLVRHLLPGRWRPLAAALNRVLAS